MITWKSDIVAIAYEDGIKIAIEYQNGQIEKYMLKPVTKQDNAHLLGITE